MPPKFPSTLPYLILLPLIFFYTYSTSLLPHSTTITSPPPCNLSRVNWVPDPAIFTKPLYDEPCPFHRNAWICLRNQRENTGLIISWRWVPKDCDFPKIDPERFLELVRNRNIGFVGDSLNENFKVSFFVVLKLLMAVLRSIVFIFFRALWPARFKILVLIMLLSFDWVV